MVKSLKTDMNRTATTIPVNGS